MRRRVGLIGIASVVALGVAVLPGSPAAAEEYQGTCGSVFVSNGVFTITSGDAQAGPGGSFTLSNLRVQKDSSHGSGADVELVVSVGDLDGQIIELGDSFVIDEGPDFGHRVWDEVPAFTLEAPEGLGPHDITAELVRYDFPNLTNDVNCVLEGEPFAEVVVSDDPPPTTTTTTTTTTTVPDGNGDNGDNGNGDNGDNGNGENGNGTPGVSPGEEAEEDAVEDAVEEIAREVAAAERALTVGAAPRFAG